MNLNSIKKGMISLSIGISMFVTSLLANAYPNVPKAIVEGGGAIIGDTVYVGLGSNAGDNFYSLDLNNAKATWQLLPAFPGGSRKQPLIAAVSGKLYVLGGIANVNGITQLINDAWVYDPTTKTWTQLPTRSPIGIVGASTFVRNNKIYITGGSNTSIFDGIFQDLSSIQYLPNNLQESTKDAILDAYFNKPVQDYFFNQILVSYNPVTNTWENLGIEPFQGRAGAGVAYKDNKFIVVDGEIKPGLRTPNVYEGLFLNNSIQYISLPSLSTTGPDVNSDSDGMSGTYTGWLGNNLVVAGGSAFIGAMANYNNGNYYAHKGLTKTYLDGIYSYNIITNTWSQVGKLPQGMGYGVTIPYKNQLILISGELNNNQTTSAIYTIELENNKIQLKDPNNSSLPLITPKSESNSKLETANPLKTGSDSSSDTQSIKSTAKSENKPVIQKK